MKEAESSHRPTLIIVVVLAAIFSSFTLWLIDSWIKYPLSLFETFTIIVLYLVSIGYDFKPAMPKRIKIESLHFRLPVIDTLLIISAASLLVFNVTHTQGSLLQLILALFTTSILPGYALLNIFGLEYYFSKLENVVLSYILSYVFTGFMTFAFLFVGENTRALIVLGSCILLGFISALKHRKPGPFSRPRSLSRSIDSLAILVGIAFFALSFYLMYPGFTLLRGTDISRIYRSSIVLGRTPDLYLGSTYLLANLHESMFIALSNPSLTSAQMGLLALNFFLIPAFYVMAKPFLEKIDARLPSLATIFWVLFTNGYGGFAWILFTSLKLAMPSGKASTLLGLTNAVAYNGTGYGILGLWYVPATISFVVLMGAIFLLGKKEIPSTKYFALFSTVIAALCLTHVVEAVALAVFLAVYWVLSKNTELKIDLALKASAFGFALVVAAYYIFSQFDPFFALNLPLILSVTLPIILLTLSLGVRKFGKFTSLLEKFKHELRFRLGSKKLALLAGSSYVVALLSSISLVSSFQTAQVYALGVVPWYMYPIILGITGLLSMVAIYYIAEKGEPYKSLWFFIAFMFFAFIVGELVTVTNLYFFNVGFWEDRFIWFMKLPLALLAPIPVLLLIGRLRKHFSNNTSRAVVSVALIGIVCLSGISTTFLNVEYWNISSTSTANYPTQTELSGIAALKGILDNDPRAYVATVTSKSASTIVFAAPADTLGLGPLLYTASTPEMAFTQLYRAPEDAHPYVYLQYRDANYLSQYGGQFLTKYLTMTPVVFNNSEVTIYNVSKPSFPQPESQNVLIVPFDGSQQNTLAAYCMLSNGFYNYTVMYDMDHNALNGTTAVLSFDPPEGNITSGTFQDNFNETLNSWSVLQGTWNAEEGHLIGAGNLNSVPGVLLSQVFAENFTATVNVKPLKGNQAFNSLADIVYSWVDPKNYRIAEINFDQDRHAYVLFRNYVNGVETPSFPKWPGSEIALKWNYGDEYSLKLTVNGTLNELSINNTKVLVSNMENLPGKIGLRYYRLFEVSFDNFSVNYDTGFHLRPVGDYVKYLNSGHRLVVLDTNGGGFFANDLLSASNSTIVVQQIKGNGTELQLPYPLTIPSTNVKDSSVRTLSYYTGATGETPFILQKDYGNGGELFYVNVQPIIQALQTNSDRPAFSALLGKLLDGLNLKEITPTDPLSSVSAYVKEISLHGNATIQTDSVLFPRRVDFENVEVKEGSSSHIFYNVTSIAVSDYSRAIIEADNALTQDGNGFYTEFLLNSTFSIRPSSGSFDLKVTTNNETLDIGSVDSLSVKPIGSFQLQVRIPTVSALGVTFTGFYPEHFGQLITQISGQDLYVVGLTEFSIMISDTYKAISNLTLGSSLRVSPPITQYDLLSTLPTALFWSLMVLAVFLGDFFIFKKRRELALGYLAYKMEKSVDWLTQDLWKTWSILWVISIPVLVAALLFVTATSTQFSTILGWAIVVDIIHYPLALVVLFFYYAIKKDYDRWKKMK